MLIFLISAVLTPRVLSSANPNNVTCSASALGPCYVDGKSNLGKVKTTDPGDCCAACIANAECYHWQIHSKSCHLRARENGMNKGDDCIRDAAPSPPRPSPGPSPAPTPPAPPAPPSPPVAPPPSALNPTFCSCWLMISAITTLDGATKKLVRRTWTG